jgi:DNA-binding LytR/AlgR family response regulator
MKALETKLDETIFVRNHRSFLTNISKIDSFSSTTIKIGDKEIPVSRTGLLEMKQYFQKNDRLTK